VADNSLILEIEASMDFDKMQLKKFDDIIDDFRWSKVDVTRLENAMKEKNEVKELAPVFEKFERDFRRILRLRDRLSYLDAILHLMANPDNVNNIEQLIIDLERNTSLNKEFQSSNDEKSD